jgi:hypothetical protein
LVVPVTVKAAVRKQALTVPLPAPMYWHSRHQHTRVTIGGSGLSQRTAPHKHLPVVVIARTLPKSGSSMIARSMNRCNERSRLEEEKKCENMLERGGLRARLN